MRFDAVGVVLTPLNITVTRFTQLGMPVKSIDVPLVDATAVPLTIALFAPLMTAVPLVVGNEMLLLPATAGAVSSV
jgi:hypothetical protein